jgi:hypothetical protein
MFYINTFETVTFAAEPEKKCPFCSRNAKEIVESTIETAKTTEISNPATEIVPEK